MLVTGPTLWHFENERDASSLELPLEDVKALARQIGFELSVRPLALIPSPYLSCASLIRFCTMLDCGQDEREVETSYTSNPRSLLRHTYTAGFWTARKVERAAADAK